MLFMIIGKNYLEYTAIIHLPDRVPISILSFQNAARLAGMTVREYCQSGQCMAEAQLAYWETFLVDAVRRFGVYNRRGIPLDIGERS